MACLQFGLNTRFPPTLQRQKRSSGPLQGRNAGGNQGLGDLGVNACGEVTVKDKGLAKADRYVRRHLGQTGISGSLPLAQINRRILRDGNNADSRITGYRLDALPVQFEIGYRIPGGIKRICRAAKVW